MSFLNPWFVDLLREYNVAIFFGDTALRLHGESPQHECDIFVYFDNDAKVRATVDAKSLIKKVSGPELAQ